MLGVLDIKSDKYSLKKKKKRLLELSFINVHEGSYQFLRRVYVGVIGLWTLLVNEVFAVIFFRLLQKHIL